MIKRHERPIYGNNEYDFEPKIMEFSDSLSSGSMSPRPPHKSGARRGRPRLTEDAELAKQVPWFIATVLTGRNDARSYVMHNVD